MGIDPANHQSTRESLFFKKAETMSNESRDGDNINTDLNLELQICPPSHALKSSRGKKRDAFLLQPEITQQQGLQVQSAIREHM